jgi:hypothetical protein
MKTVGRYLFTSLALALLVFCIGSGPANAQGNTCTFDLPFVANWNGITLAPGQYSFRFERPLGLLRLTRGQKYVAAILSASVDRQALTKSSLMIEQSYGVNSVTELRLADWDMVVHFLPVKPANHRAIEERGAGLAIPVGTSRSVR